MPHHSADPLHALVTARPFFGGKTSQQLGMKRTFPVLPNAIVEWVIPSFSPSLGSAELQHRDEIQSGELQHIDPTPRRKAQCNR